MAYVSSYQDELKKKEDAAGAVNTSGVVNGTVTGTATGAPEQQAKTPGTGFTNLSQYLDMNKGVGGQLATKATEDVSKAADSYTGATQKALNEAQTKFGEASGSGKAEQLKSSIVQDANTYKQDALGFLGSGYKGPTAGDYTAGLAADKTKLQSDLGRVDDITQQQAGLEKAYGKTGNYSQGFGLLDTFLMRGDESGQQKINEVKGKAQTVGTAYDTTAKTLQQKEQEARQALKQNQQSVVETARNQKSALESSAAQKAEAMNRDLQAKKNVADASQASLGDALDDTTRADLEALAEIANLDRSDDWYKRTFNAGREVAPPPAPEPLKPGSPGTLQVDPDMLTREPSPEEKAAFEAKKAADRKALEDAGIMDSMQPGTLQIDTSAWDNIAPPPVRKTKSSSGTGGSSKNNKNK